MINNHTRTGPNYLYAIASRTKDCFAIYAMQFKPVATARKRLKFGFQAKLTLLPGEKS